VLARIDRCAGAKNQIQALVRRYGYGVPNLGRALLSTRNDPTLMVEDELQPFRREGNSAAKMRDMKLHRLPWPRKQLAALGAAPLNFGQRYPILSNQIPVRADGPGATAMPHMAYGSA
jgi:hypothetical protein